MPNLMHVLSSRMDLMNCGGGGRGDGGGGVGGEAGGGGYGDSCPKLCQDQ